MQRVLFHDTVFGPIHSRRLGTSLGINLMPNDGKVCSFDCLYCEAGFNAQGRGTTGLPTRAQVAGRLEAKLREMSAEGQPLDVITFSGNGEPTLHPEFDGVIDDTIALRDKYFPQVKISVLSNSTRLSDERVCRALSKVDNNILKLDSAIVSTVALLDRPAPGYDLAKVIDRIAAFGKDAIVQTMLVRGSFGDRRIDNTTTAEIDALIDAYRRIAPGEIMIYSIDRPTPAKDLQRVPPEDMQRIGQRIEKETGIPVQITGG